MKMFIGVFVVALSLAISTIAQAQPSTVGARAALKCGSKGGIYKVTTTGGTTCAAAFKVLSAFRAEKPTSGFKCSFAAGEGPYGPVVCKKTGKAIRGTLSE